MHKNPFVISALVAILIFVGFSLAKTSTKTVSNDEVQTKSEITLKSVSVDSNSLASVSSASMATKKIVWETSSYPKNAGVNINLIRKVSDNPASYTLVRQIAVNTPNDGVESWNPSQNETGNDLYIEVNCGSNYQFTNGCSSSLPIKAN
jgi:hypothetical protein